MTIEVPLPDLTALPVWAYVTGGVWAWYLMAAVVVRVMTWAGVFRRYAAKAATDDVIPVMIAPLSGGFQNRDDWRRVLAGRAAAVMWVVSPLIIPFFVVLTALWSSAHVASLGLVPRPWSKGATA